MSGEEPIDIQYKRKEVRKLKKSLFQNKSNNLNQIADRREQKYDIDN